MAEKILKEIRLRLSFLVNVGLEYLTLSRSAETLSAAQQYSSCQPDRRTANEASCMPLDETSIGLRQRDNERFS